MKVPLTVPYTDEREKELLHAVLDSGWLTQGKCVHRFEAAVAHQTGAQHALATTSCTTALHLALLALGIGPGDEVVTPTYTWIASPNAVRMVGAQPVFADVSPQTFNLTAETVEVALTPRTRAVMAVHQFGAPCDMDALAALCAERGLELLEDAACALGSSYKGTPLGGLGNMACFSFHPRKLVTTGEGGMVTCDSEAHAEQLARLRNHGASASDLHKHKAGTVEALLAETFPEMGYNYRMTELQGAVGVAQMERLDWVLERRHHLAETYLSELAGAPGLRFQELVEGGRSNWQSFALRIQGGRQRRDAVAQSLLDAGVACRPGYMTCHTQPAYAGCCQRPLPGAEQAFDTALLVPLYPQMGEEEQEHVITSLRKAL